MKVAAIGLDLAKHWFQVHGVDARGQTVVRRKLRRSEVLGGSQRGEVRPDGVTERRNQTTLGIC